jgi:hypothetical protein
VVAGAALLVVLSDGLIFVDVNPYYQRMVVGVVLFVAIVVDRLRVRRLERLGGRTGLEVGTDPGGGGQSAPSVVETS